MKTSEKRRFSVNSVLKLICVSPYGYYSWKKRNPSNSALRKEAILLLRKLSKFTMNQNIWFPSILKSTGHIISEKTARIYMGKSSIKAI